MNKKAFTLIELLAVLIILAIISTIAMVIYSKYLEDATKKTFSIHEDTMKSATTLLISECQIAMNKSPLCDTISDVINTENVYKKIQLKDLLRYGFIEEEIKNPANTNLVCDNEKSFAEILSSREGYNLQHRVKICLYCDEDTKSDKCNFY